MANPALSNNPAFNGRGYATFDKAPQAPQYGQNPVTPSADELTDMYSQGSATPLETGRMTYNDVVMRTAMCFMVLLATAGVSWVMYNPILTFGGAIVGLILALVISFKKSPSPTLVMAYAAFEGLFVGGISKMYENAYSGIVVQAVLATLCVFAVSLFAFRSGKIRVTPKTQRIFMIAMGGYMLFCLVNMGSMLFFGNDTLRSGPLGFAIGLFAVGLAAFSLVMDFDFIERGVRAGLPEKFAWTAAFGLMVTLIWLYVEMLRLIAILRGDD